MTRMARECLGEAIIVELFSHGCFGCTIVFRSRNFEISIAKDQVLGLGTVKHC